MESWFYERSKIKTPVYRYNVQMTFSELRTMQGLNLASNRCHFYIGFGKNVLTKPGMSRPLSDLNSSLHG